MRIVFMGTPQFAVPTLDRLLADGHEVAAVYTQPPRPAGRGKALRASPVQDRAEALRIEVRSPIRLRDEADQRAFRALDADIAVVAAYGLILPQPVLDAPRLGCLNVHASLLPRWRGAAPIQRAILAGDVETGVTIMRMERGLDTGPMLLSARTRCAGRNAGDLTTELAELGAELMSRVLADPAAHPPRPQPLDGVTLAPKIVKAETRIDFAQPAELVARQVDAFSPTPGAFFEVAGERIRILQAEPIAGDGEPGTVIDENLRIACGTGAIAALRVQREGRGAMDAGDLLRGFPIPAGTRLA